MLTIETPFNFNQLSLKDLIEARDLFHVHLMNKRNVVATALGRYRIRQSDPFPNDRDYKTFVTDSKTKKSVRYLSNSEVRDYSWPCILVFVSEWKNAIDLVTGGNTDLIPKRIYMPDGRIVPICVVQAEKVAVANDEVQESDIIFPTNIISGGFPLLIESQGVERVASVGCLVTDGNKYYALTNKHVAGDLGTEVYTRKHGDLVRIGISTDKQINKVGFSDLYPEWNCRKVFVNNDIALVEIDNINDWKTEVLGIGQIDEMADLDTSNFTLNLISTNIYENKVFSSTTSKVLASGAVSGKLNGEIVALFYRYKSKGGIEYIADFLIGGQNGAPLSAHRGDSGTLWLLETQDRDMNKYRQPLAVQWGQHDFFEGSNRFKNSYVLATCLSNACRILDVDIVRGWNLDIDNSWGKTGHYGIGNLSTEFIPDEDLKTLMQKNITNISFAIADINPDWDSKNKQTKAEFDTKFKTFCPLADVPDIIWKQSPKTTQWGRQGAENVNHYLDSDIPLKEGQASFIDLVDTANKLTVEKVQYYYDNIDMDKIKMTSAPSKGILPLRVWQIFDYMVEALQKEDAARFVFSAGVMTHYTGDACQPLHSSYMSNGDPADNEPVQVTAKKDSFHKNGTLSHKKDDVYSKTINPGDGVHVAYEDSMIDAFKDEIIRGIQSIAADKNHAIMKEPLPDILDGQSAGFAIVKLMDATQNTIKPKEIVEAFKKNKKSPDLLSMMWSQFGQRTIECMSRGSRYQAAIWQAAWKKSEVDLSVFDTTDFTSLDFQNKLKSLYNDPNEMKSYYLDQIGEVLKKVDE